jgi:hypothetical protein
VEKVRRLRAMGSLCRQQAAYNSMNKWKLLAEAEYSEHLAQLELSSYFRECNALAQTRSHRLKHPPMRMTTDGMTHSAHLRQLKQERLSHRPTIGQRMRISATRRCDTSKHVAPIHRRVTTVFHLIQYLLRPA